MNLANCEDFVLPVSGFDDCDPEVNYSEIERILVGAPKAAAFTDITDEAEWNTRLSQTSTGINAIRPLTVIADMPAAAAVVKEISNGRKKNIGKDYTVNYTADDISDANYNFFLVLDEKPTIRLFGFETQAGKLYHYGNAGILVNHSSNGILARGRDEIEVENGVITWRRLKRPQRIDSPIFEGEDDETAEPVTYDTELTFASLTTAEDASVSAVVDATDAQTKFEFVAIGSVSGTPQTMDINVGSDLAISVTFPSDYAGESFKFTDKNGVAHTGVFTNGELTF